MRSIISAPNMSSTRYGRSRRVPCYWCGTLYWNNDLTNDHIIPLGNNGPDVTSNIVRACECCNRERGYIVNAFAHCRYLGLDHSDRNAMIQRFLPTLIKVKQLQTKWALIEKQRIGRSPSLDMPLIIKIVASNNNVKHYNASYRTALKKARQAAESRFLKKKPTFEEIAFRAYFIWLGSGGDHGYDREHWLQAEMELISGPGEKLI